MINIFYIHLITAITFLFLVSFIISGISYILSHYEFMIEFVSYTKDNFYVLFFNLLTSMFISLYLSQTIIFLIGYTLLIILISMHFMFIPILFYIYILYVVICYYKIQVVNDVILIFKLIFCVISIFTYFYQDTITSYINKYIFGIILTLLYFHHNNIALQLDTNNMNNNKYDGLSIQNFYFFLIFSVFTFFLLN